MRIRDTSVNLRACVDFEQKSWISQTAYGQWWHAVTVWNPMTNGVCFNGGMIGTLLISLGVMSMVKSPYLVQYFCFCHSWGWAQKRHWVKIDRISCNFGASNSLTSQSDFLQELFSLILSFGNIARGSWWASWNTSQPLCLLLAR